MNRNQLLSHAESRVMKVKIKAIKKGFIFLSYASVSRCNMALNNRLPTSINVVSR